MHGFLQHMDERAQIGNDVEIPFSVVGPDVIVDRSILKSHVTLEGPTTMGQTMSSTLFLHRNFRFKYDGESSTLTIGSNNGSVSVFLSTVELSKEVENYYWRSQPPHGLQPCCSWWC